MKCYVHPDVDAVGTCTNCGKTVCSNCAMEVGGKLVCKNCAQNLANRQVSAPSAANKKEPFLALILSFLIPGLGQLYNGDLTKGIFLFLGAIVSVVLMFVCIGFLTYLAIWIYGMYDAYIYAEKINRGEVKY